MYIRILREEIMIIIISTLWETLINCLSGMKRKAHGAQEPKHIQKYVEVTSAAQRSDSPVQAINQCFLISTGRKECP